MKDIKGYEGEYAVTSCGKVWSYKRKQFLKPWNNGQGYLQVTLTQNGIQKKHKVHRLVAEAYLDNPDGLPLVNHKDEIKTHNWVNNLEWCTAEYNVNYSTRNYEECGRAKSIKCIELDTIYPSAAEAGRQLNIHKQSIYNCLRGKQHTAGGYCWEYVKEVDAE